MRDEQQTLEQIGAAIAAGGTLEVTAKKIADTIRMEGGYQRVGVYQVVGDEMCSIAWTGTEMPAFARFPVTKGLTRDVIKTCSPVVSADVSKDSRYLVAFGGTRSEMIVPVVGRAGMVIGTVEVESDRVNAFGESDVRFLEQCTAKMVPLFEGKDAMPRP